MLKSPELVALPVARYFAVVGGALAALLLIAGWTLPELPDRFPVRRDNIDGATIRIESARKWPEKVVLDTGQPTFAPASIDAAPARDQVAQLPDETTDKASVAPVANSVAKSKADARPIAAYHPPMRARHKTTRVAQSTHVARGRGPAELQSSVEACCWFEPIDRRATSRPASRNHVARRDSWTGWQLPEAN
ncbi:MULTISPECIES: hypothetical protein [unclassified Bradyrhizobium]|uniref:hypothetical protein n=1 Tax=unclassified Bradyrhizobium TaxID=2631580 RepID=UPI00339B4F26